MSTSASNIDLTHPDLTEDQEIVIPKPIASTQGLKLLALGLNTKARDYEECYEHVYVYRCKNNHMWPMAITCHERYCDKGCADNIALALVEKYHKIEVTGEFLFIEISQAGELVPAFVQEFNKFIGEGFKSLESMATVPLGTLWHTFATKGHLTAYLLLWGEVSPSCGIYHNAWRGATVRTSIRPAHQFHDALHMVFAAHLPKSPTTRAEYEFLFHGLRTVHTMGTLYSHPPTTEEKLNGTESTTPADETANLFPQEPTPGNNSPNVPTCLCPHCGEPATHVSNRREARHWRHANAPGRGYRWYTHYKGTP